jgi:hypothetical protein
MTTATEIRAETFLLERFNHEDYKFEKPAKGESGFDLWLLDKRTGNYYWAELKATNGKFQSPCNIREKLVFNHANQKRMFEIGDTVLVRVFLGNRPYKVVLMDCGVLGIGAKIKQQPRYEFKGNLDYSGIEILT